MKTAGIQKGRNIKKKVVLVISLFDRGHDENKLSTA